jgi:hypothetical protein
VVDVVDRDAVDRSLAEGGEQKSVRGVAVVAHGRRPALAVILDVVEATP